MSMYDAFYGREGRGVGPNEPEKKGFARFCQMVGRDLGHRKERAIVRKHGLPVFLIFQS